MAPLKRLESKAVYDFVVDGVYPADPSITSSPIASAALDALGKSLAQARSNVQVSIRELSALSAPDIDGWISQAKRLRVDRESSIAESAAIQQLHNEHDAFIAKEKDASAQVTLLKGEVEFTEGLKRALETVRKTREAVARGGECLGHGDLVGAVELMREAEAHIEEDKLDRLSGTSTIDLLLQRITEQKDRIAQQTDDTWNRLIEANVQNHEFRIQDGKASGPLADVFKVVEELGTLDAKLAGINQSLYESVFEPRFNTSTGSKFGIHIEGSAVFLRETSSKDDSLSRLFTEVANVKRYLNARLPESANNKLTELVMPRIEDHIMLNVLPRAVPPNLDGLSAFNRTLSSVSSFSDEMSTLGWQGTGRLTTWASNAPQIWLQARSADSLSSLRQVLKRGLGNPRSVERVETQKVIEGDGILAAAGQDRDDWDADWDEGGDTKRTEAERSAKEVQPPATVDEDEDASGWGWDDDGEDKKVDAGETVIGADDDDDGGAAAWDAWDEDNQDADGPNHTPATTKIPPEKAATSTKQARVERTVTLREFYHITALPEQVLEVVIMVVEDADSLSKAEDKSNPVIEAGPSLYALPGTLLAMFRAAAPMAYGTNESGNMYLYNDSQYLAEQLRSFSEHHGSRVQGHDLLVLEQDIVALEIFGKRAYSREMDAQRTILGDLLDGAQGFSNCTEEPQASQCDLAVTSVIDRIRQVHAQWRDVLSTSAVLQAIGSLISTVVGKVILEVEDLSDIGEAESRRLTGYCTSISSLEDIFMPEASAIQERGGEEEEEEEDTRVPSTAVYAPAWLKFQYLTNILESSLVDIKYLWAEGGLALEYSCEEVVDLIKALFADSPRRRETINEIRRS